MKSLWALFGKKQGSVSSAAAILVIMVFASRILGLIRDRMLAARFAPDDLGVYFAAFRIPNLLFELLVMGALTSAFIPIFTKYITKDDRADAWKMASTLINISSLLLVIISLPLIIWAREISQFLAPGFSVSQINQMTVYTRFMILFQVMPLLAGNFFTGILQSFRLFFIPAIAPVLYNIGIILGIYFFSTAFGLFAPVIGVGIGALLFFIIHIPILRQVGYRHDWSISLSQKGVRDVARLIGPRTLGLAVSQIDTTVDLMLASLLGARMVTIFNFAQHLQQLPVGLFGATIAQAALPILSFSTAQENTRDFRETITHAVHQILFFVLPFSVLFIVLRIPIVRLVFGASRFDWQATVLTGATLSFFSLSLFAQSIIHVLARGFYALYDSKTPVVIGILSIVINTFLSLILILTFHLPVWSLGFSTSVASIVNMVCLWVLLEKRIGGLFRMEFLLPPIKMAIASVTMGFALYIPLKLFDQLVFDTTRTFGLLLLSGAAGILGSITYFFLSWVFGVGEVHSFIRLLLRVRRTVIFEPATEVVNGGAGKIE